jgi:hypothetical protein
MKLKQVLTVRWTPDRLLFAAAACIYLLLALLPATRWLVRRQSMPGFYKNMGGDQWHQQNLAEAAKHPDDFQMQFAAAIQHPEAPMPDGSFNSRARAQRVWALRTQFPNEPAVYAAAVRYCTQAGVRTGRDADQDVLLTPTARAVSAATRSKLPEKPLVPGMSDMTDLYAEAAVEGERLDPQNGFFPMMQAVTFFAANRDTEGLAALERAARKPRWNDYASEEAWSGDKLTQAAHGETGTIATASRHAAILFPHLAQFHATARVAIALAVRKELAGDRDGGWSIRSNVARCGAVIWSDASSYIGSLVGMAITQAAMSRPGGEELPDRQGKSKDDEQGRLQAERFLAYANNIGRSDDTAFFQAERVAREEARGLYREVEEKTLFSMPRLTEMMALWAGGSALVCNALVVLVMGGVAFGLAQMPRIRLGQPLHPAIRWGLAALAASIPFAAIGHYYLNGEGLIVGYVAACLSVTGAAMAALRSSDAARRNLLIFVATLPSTAALLALLSFGTVYANQTASEVGGLLGLHEFGVIPAFLMAASNGTTSLPGMIQVVLPISGGAAFCAVWLAALAMRARCRRQPISVGIVRGAASSALTVASILLFAYAALTLVTWRAEQRGLAELAEMGRHEGRYFARLTGKPWPGLPAER